MSAKVKIPSLFFRSSANKLFNEVKNGHIVERAHETYHEKSYLDSYKPHYKAAKFASYAFQFISMCFAFTFVHQLFSGLFSAPTEIALYTSIGLSVGALVIIELFKRLCLGSFVVSVIRSKALHSEFSVNWGALLINLGLIAISVYTSCQGAKIFTKLQIDQSKEIGATHQAETDSINTHYSQSIGMEQKALADFKKSVSWKGKINIHNKTTAKVIDNHTNKIERLEGERLGALAAISKAKQDALADNQKKSDGDSSIMFWVSLFCELTTLLCICFVYGYLSKVYIEHGAIMLEDENSIPSQNYLNDVNQPSLNRAGIIAEKEASTPIGFKHYPLKESLNTSLNSLKYTQLQQYLKKYANVVEDIEKGLSNAQIAKNCGISVSTVHNVKRCLRNLNSAKIQ